MNDYPMHMYQFPPKDRSITENSENGDIVITETRNIAVQMADMMDQEIMSAIRQTAAENGITNLVVLDKKFVMDALREKMERDGLV